MKKSSVKQPLYFMFLLGSTTLISDGAMIVVSAIFVVLTGLWGRIFKVEAIDYLVSRILS